MSVPKIKGIETEWSISIKNMDGYFPAIIQDFERMINSIKKYFGLPIPSSEEAMREIENIDRVSELMRDREFILSLHSRLFRHNLLPNGGRLYVDGPHLEYSTPECLSARALVAADKAGEAILNLARISFEQSSSEGTQMVIYKDNSDRNGHSYGCHENYLISRDAFDRIMTPHRLEVGYLASYFVCRLLFAGSGKMGVEIGSENCGESVYQISQRADFMRRLLSNDTVIDRGIVNNRDEPLSDCRKYGRLHVIVGDANLADIANYMKVGITSIILRMIEDNFLTGDIIIDDPVSAIKSVSFDLTCKKPVVQTLGGRKLSSLNLNEEYFGQAKDYLSKVAEPSAEEIDLMQKWEETISDFHVGNEARLRRRLDWKIKEGINNEFLEAHGFSWKDIGRATVKNSKGVFVSVAEQLVKKDLYYHDINKEKGLFWAKKEDGEVEELVTRDEVISMIKAPPPECRSYFRGRCIGKFFPEIKEVDWDEITFQDNASVEPLGGFNVTSVIKVGMGNPAWGGKDDVGEFFDNANNCHELLKKLQSREGGQ